MLETEKAEQTENMIDEQKAKLLNNNYNKTFEKDQDEEESSQTCSSEGLRLKIKKYEE